MAHRGDPGRRRFRLPRPLVLGGVLVFAGACGGREAENRSLGETPLLHLEDHLKGAVVDSALPGAPPSERLWRFDEARPEWRQLSAAEVPALSGVALERLADGLRLSLSPPRTPEWGLLVGGIAVDLEGLSLDDWESVLVRARSSDRFAGITVGYNLDEEGAVPHDSRFFLSSDEAPPIFSDGSEQTYAIPLRPREKDRGAVALRSLGILVGAPDPADLDILSVALVPRGASFREKIGVRPVTRDGVTRRTLFAHAPATLAYRVRLPAGARLDVGLTALAGEVVTYRVSAGDEADVLLEETVAGSEPWRQRSVDLSHLAAGTIDLVLAATSARPGAVALWGAPILSGAGRAPRRLPNIIFYVIDGGGADLMSVYGYNRRTTPFLERLAEEGAVFEHAYSNSTWTQPSTASFMTSLHHSVLGGLRRGVHSTPIPAAAVTMAEHLHRAGYQTASFTSNPNCGRIIGLERGVDLMRDVEAGHHSTSSAELHERFRRFREAYPGAPYWVHFQTTDVHEPNQPEEPFSGLFVTADERARLAEWEGRMWEVAGAEFGTTSIAAFYDLALARAGVDRQAYFGVRRGLYDETMAHQDHQLGRLVERLKAAGEWEGTLLVIAADHGHPAGTFARFGRGLFEPQPEPWQGALFDSYSTRVPLIFVWPGHIRGGVRFARPVSMIDVLPTILDLVGLPQPEVMQGQSVAPLMLSRTMEVRPVILDEFRIDEASGEMIGNLEIIDGRWGASLEVGPLPEGADRQVWAGTHRPDQAREGTRAPGEFGRYAVPAGGRWGAVHPFFPAAPRLLLYDLGNDPFALRIVNDEHPDLVEHYRQVLLTQWRAHRALAQRFREADEAPLTPEQLHQLRSLGYIP